MWNSYRGFLSLLKEVITEIWQIINQNVFIVSIWDFFQPSDLMKEKANTILSFTQKVNICLLEIFEMCHLCVSVSIYVSSIVNERPNLSICAFSKNISLKNKRKVRKVLVKWIFRTKSSPDIKSVYMNWFKYVFCILNAEYKSRNDFIFLMLLHFLNAPAFGAITYNSLIKKH